MCWIKSVVSTIMAMLQSILKIRTDASNRLGCVSMERITWSVRCFDFLRCPNSPGFSEKNATSAPDINAEEDISSTMTKNSINTAAVNGVRMMSRKNKDEGPGISNAVIN